MVKGIDGNDNIIRFKGQDQNIDTSKLEGLKKTEKNKVIFEKFDSNNDGSLNKTEADNMQGWLKETAGNTKISKREMEKGTKDKSSFEALSYLAQQQAALDNNNEYLETNQEITTHVVKKDDKITKFDSTKNEKDETVETYEDGSTKVIHEDNSYDITDKDGTITKYDKDGNKTAVIKDDLTTTFSPDGKTTTKNKEGEIVEETEVKDDKEIKTTFERKDGKTIKRQTTDGTLNFITVSEQTTDGHTIDTSYKTEDDMNNNKPSEIVRDAQNETTKTITRYEYLEDGNVKITTIDSSGKETVKFQNDKGEEIENPNPEETHTVKEGQGITAIVKELLKQQGIENPTAEQLKKAKDDFLELNKDLVKTYHGVKKEWHGNKYFYIGDKVKIPDFKKTGETEPAKPTLTDEQKQKIEALHTEQTQPEIEKIQEILGENFVVEENDGKLVVKDKQGNILEEITQIVNDEDNDPDDIAEILKSDNNNNQTIEYTEFKSFAEAQIKDIQIDITDANRATIEEIIKKHFNNMDTIQKDGSLTKEELEANTQKVLNELLDELRGIK